MTGTFSFKKIYVAFWPFHFCAHPFLHCSDLSDLMFISSSPCCLPPPLPSHLPPVSRFCAHPFLSSHRFTIFEFDVYVVLSSPALVFRHIVSLLVCFVSHGFASVLHPKFLFRFKAKQAKLGGQFRYFSSKSFASVSLRSEIRGHSTSVPGMFGGQHLFARYVWRTTPLCQVCL